MRLISLVACLATSWITSAYAEAPAGEAILSGGYVLVAERRASGVAAPQGGWEAAPGTVTFGPELTFGQSRSCVDWETVALDEAPLDANDPMLSDAVVGPHPGPASTGDRRLNQGFAILCDGSQIAVILAVDRRVIVVPSPDGAVYAILEKPLAPHEVARLQEQLRTMKFYLGDITGELDDATTEAVASYALYRGAAYRFTRAAITENLLDGLGVIAGGFCCSMSGPHESVLDVPLAESYRVVAVRAASSAAPTNAGQDLGSNLIGAEVRFGASPVWYDGHCDTGEVRRSNEAPAGRDDPNLSDLQVVPSARDYRVNRGIVLDCGGVAHTSIHHLLVIDERVLVASTADGTTFVILESPLAEHEVLRLKNGLRSAGFAVKPGGDVDDETRAAIAAFAQAHGANGQYEIGVLTANIWDALSSSDDRE